MKRLYVLLLTLASVFATNSTPHRVPSRSSKSLSERVLQLNNMSSHQSVIRLDGQQFLDLVHDSPRNYSVVVLFIATAAKHRCTICRPAHDELTIVADSYRRAPTSPDRLHFAVLDHQDGADAFRLLNMISAPNMLHFPAVGKPSGRDTMNISLLGYSALAIRKWVAERTGVAIRVVHPTDYAKWCNAAMLVLFIVCMLYKRRDHLGHLVEPTFWGIGLVGFCCVMTSGQMWNLIRGTYYYVVSETGSLSLISGWHGEQFVAETVIVMAVNALIVLGMVMMTEAGEASSTATAEKRTKLMIVGLSIVLASFSFLLALFGAKMPHYPYSLFIKFARNLV